MYRRYVTLHTGASIAVFAIGAVWIIISASRHSTAQSNCEATFFSVSGSNGSTSEGETLCDIFSWVDVGLMAGAWVFFALVQVSDERDALAIHMLNTASRVISSSCCHRMAPLNERITRSMTLSMIQPDHWRMMFQWLIGVIPGILEHPTGSMRAVVRVTRGQTARRLHSSVHHCRRKVMDTIPTRPVFPNPRTLISSLLVNPILVVIDMDTSRLANYLIRMYSLTFQTAGGNLAYSWIISWTLESPLFSLFLCS